MTVRRARSAWFFEAAPAGRGGAWGLRRAAAIPLLAMPAAALLLRDRLPAWGFMAALAAALFAGCKVATLALAPRAPLGRTLGYLLLWPGMDAKRFLAGAAAAPEGGEWGAAILKTTAGVALFAGAGGVRGAAAAWLGMAGLVLALHCGVFHLLSCAWRAAGVEAPPLMDAPLLAASPSRFWNARWNRAFSDLCRAFVVGPLRRTPRLALFAAFALSGIAHELVISVPARGGWGLPTAYFLVQGAAVALERSRLGKRLGLGGGVAGRVFAWVVVAAPVPLLFHSAFLENVILPMVVRG